RPPGPSDGGARGHGPRLGGRLAGRGRPRGPGVLGGGPPPAGRLTGRARAPQRDDPRHGRPTAPVRPPGLHALGLRRRGVGDHARDPRPVLRPAVRPRPARTGAAAPVLATPAPERAARRGLSVLALTDAQTGRLVFAGFVVCMALITLRGGLWGRGATRRV